MKIYASLTRVSIYKNKNTILDSKYRLFGMSLNGILEIYKKISLNIVPLYLATLIALGNNT